MLDELNILELLNRELEECDLSEEKKKDIRDKVSQKYFELLNQSAANADRRNGGSESSISLQDVKDAIKFVQLTTIPPEKVKFAIDQAADWLLQRGQNGTWGWYSAMDPSELKESIIKIWSTAITIRALLRAGISSGHPQVEKGVKWLIDNKLTGQKASWGILPKIYYSEKYMHYFLANTYETSCVLLTLLENEDIQSLYKDVIHDGIDTLLLHQRKSGGWSIFLSEEQESYDDSDTGATSLALTTISRALKYKSVDYGKVHSSIDDAAAWLRSKQRESGAWGDFVHTQGCTTKTCDAIRALAESGPIGSYKSINLGVIWLLENQGATEEGRGWSWSKTDEDKKSAVSTVENTAFAIIALLKAHQRVDSAAVQMGIRWLLSRQKDNNWSGDTQRVIFALSAYLKIVYKTTSRELARILREKG